MPSLGSVSARSLDRDEPCDFARGSLPRGGRRDRLSSRGTDRRVQLGHALHEDRDRRGSYAEPLLLRLSRRSYWRRGSGRGNDRCYRCVGLLQLARLGASVAVPAPEVGYRRVGSTGILQGAERDRFADALRRASGWTGRIPDNPVAVQATQPEGGSEW